MQDVSVCYNTFGLNKHVNCDLDGVCILLKLFCFQCCLFSYMFESMEACHESLEKSINVSLLFLCKHLSCL